MKPKEINIIGISGRMGSGKDTIARMIKFATCPRGVLTPTEIIRIVREEGLQLIESLQSPWKIKKFATKLKQVASILTGIPEDKFEDQEFKKQKLPEEWLNDFFYNVDMATIPDGMSLDESLKLIRDKKEKAKGIIATKVMKSSGNLTDYRSFLQVLGTDALRFRLHSDVWVNALWANYVEYHPVDDRSKLKFPKWIISDVRFKNEAKSIKDRGGIVIRLTRNSKVMSDHISETELDNYEFDYMIDNESKSLEETYEEVAKMLKHFNIK